ncbi:MAG TPA: TlpA disulfide reductase family protein [bacterium]|nr:TlpA disulfide reductase family protein [bacterium]
MKHLVMMLLCLTGLTLFAAENDLDFELYNIGDQLYDTKQIRAKPNLKLIAVDFFSIHCEPCKKALPEWRKIYESYKGKGLEIIVVVLPVEDDREKELQKIELFFKNNPIPFALAYDKYKLVGKKYGVVTKEGSAQVPQAFIIDRAGKLVFKSEGHDEVVKKIKDILK